MLRLIADDEIVDFPLGETGTTFRIRRLHHGQAVDLQREHSRRGVLDVEAHTRAVWEHVLVGWSGLLDESGDREIEYRPALVHKVSRALPHQVAELILAEARAPVLMHHDAMGNSDASSRNGCAGTETPTTD